MSGSSVFDGQMADPGAFASGFGREIGWAVYAAARRLCVGISNPEDWLDALARGFPVWPGIAPLV
ncbi:hypothetical protein B4923_01485 [Brenneria roseae subsp. americana]|uniref:Uncharacterized protein n=1 Tax=Brenneria roseae subsp. americana TaxID=1508507 RepID=A0A2U1U2E9_9GAMM|nr:hypothetical protein B4923_01485 [Brenneria roseae subsp. americana]